MCLETFSLKKGSYILSDNLAAVLYQLQLSFHQIEAQRSDAESSYLNSDPKEGIPIKF